MVKHPLRVAGTAGSVLAFAVVVFMVVGGSDLGLGYIVVAGGVIGFGAFIAALVVLWLVHALTESTR